ncbi:N(4)-(beta-N-acetylglucosaminyl)-L-asparaginase [Agaribacter marinus]|uniref:N(4)-(Beta-N-acetylglucosaminyl)-L-asparaginase n=1 Tax=Agaribacter marinus TaxID=1431249 RepID=A0AA37T161_9ALTE|nr:N(4)-(beta-N-acetylglucosaminyl)-L-asparaginase [Agaribacter marinus]GLR70403.1 N(4)-(beta-N-acetylglucosaminyl)-L-asparaginase [Agaribacter marinus]
MHSRRHFLKVSGMLAALPTLGKTAFAKDKVANRPLVVSTWEHGGPANLAAWKVLSSGGKAIDAVEQGVMIPEADPNVMTVGYGGYPDSEGKVTLDACIMDHKQNCGSVAFLENIKHPIAVARKVMDKTPHVMLVGEGALNFAKSQGFSEENLLTDKAKKLWQTWRKNPTWPPQINIENHDTIGMLAVDERGDLSGACTTSGASFKLRGRVGDSPIIGAGLFVDNDIGAATATGMGELMMKTVGCFSVVEIMRQGASPQEACKEAVERIASKLDDYRQYQVGFLAINKQGDVGAYAIQSGFNYAVQDKSGAQLIDSRSKLA